VIVLSVQINFLLSILSIDDFVQVFVQISTTINDPTDGLRSLKMIEENDELVLIEVKIKILLAFL